MSVRSPVASRSSKYLGQMAEASMRLPRRRAWMIVLAALVLTSGLDHATGPQINLLVLYMLISCFASWCLGEKPGLIVGLSSVVLMGLINSFSGAFPVEGHHLPIGPTIWNTVGRALAFSMTVLLASGMRHTLDQASWRASTDMLTGALNRDALVRGMTGMIAQAKRRNDALLIAYIDLDGFKAVNDSFGHAAGDVLLARFAAAAERSVRASDLFARVGGDEFVMLIGLEQSAQGDSVAERLHYQLSDALRRTGYDVTCSIGALILDGRQVTSTSALIDAADSLMYEVKRSTKNALRIARGDLQPVTLCITDMASPKGRRAA